MDLLREKELRGGKIFYARLSGIHPTLPISELNAVGEVECDDFKLIGKLDLVALFTCDLSLLKSVARRVAFTKSIGVLTSVKDNLLFNRDLNDVVESLISNMKRFDVNEVGISFERLRGVSQKLISGEETIKKIISSLKKHNVRINFKSSYKVEVFLVEGMVIVGLRLLSINLKEFEKRRPRKRPFFKPGPLDPRLSRVLVNLSRLRRGEIFLDPFCGTGGIALEACLIGSSKVLCGDIDKLMSKGSRKNLDYFRCRSRSLSYIGDALKLPLGKPVDSIATDPPYGRSTSTKGKSIETIYRGFLEESLTILKKGGYLIFAGPTRIRPEKIAEDVGLNVVEKHYMYVHSSLTRTIVVSKV